MATTGEPISARASAVVPTRDRPQALERCLSALGRQRPGLELIVCDDASRDESRVVAACDAAGAIHLRLDGRGPAAARNAGVRVARTEVVLFCDDDCEPLAPWASRLLAELARAGPVVAGRTVSPPDAGPALRASQALTRALTLSSLDPLTRSLGFAPTCNLAASRELLGEIPFDESFPSAAGEDRDWCERVRRSGAEIRYAPRAVVVHRPALELRGFLRQHYGYGRGGSRYRRLAPGRRPPEAEFWSGLGREARRDGLAVGSLLAASQLAVAAGAIAEELRTGRSDRPAVLEPGGGISRAS